MPIYEYDCKDCNYQFEELVSYSNRETTPCPLCGNLATPQVSVIAGHRYYGNTGEGFYKTSTKADY